jgi:hypothetical protein
MATLQTKLRINAPGDICEQEADRIAEQVLAKPAYPDLSSAPPHVQRHTGQAAGKADMVPASVDHVLASSGSPLDPALRQDMEQRFGHDFSAVRVHSDGPAAQSARDVTARAYTVGNNIVFGEGQYVPATRHGRRLIAHELTHVVQSSRAVGITAGSALPGALMREPEAKDKAEQSKKGPDADPCRAPDPQLPVYKDAEQKQRDDILQDMLRGLTADEKKSLCKRFRRALGAFSTSQMETMKSAGVRFWRADEFPPPFKDEYAPSKKLRNEMARYQPEYRIIQCSRRKSRATGQLQGRESQEGGSRTFHVLFRERGKAADARGDRRGKETESRPIDQRNVRPLHEPAGNPVVFRQHQDRPGARDEQCEGILCRSV